MLHHLRSSQNLIRIIRSYQSIKAWETRLDKFSINESAAQYATASKTEAGLMYRVVRCSVFYHVYFVKMEFWSKEKQLTLAIG